MKNANTAKFVMMILLIAAAGISGISAAAHTEEIDLDAIGKIAIPIHILELLLSIFICFMALKFFRITKPINLFLFIYVAIGFFIVYILLNLFFHLMQHRIDADFVNVYIGSRIALVGMLLSFVMFFYKWNKTMREVNIKNK